MGMAASQVRFLSLQNRKNTIGLNLMTLSNRKLALSRDMNRVANEYNDAMNMKKLQWSNNNGVTYSDLSYDTLMKPNDTNANLPYIITDENGRVVVDDQDIVLDGVNTGVSYKDLAMMISSYSGLDDQNNTTYNNPHNVASDMASGKANELGYQIVSTANQTTSNSLRYDLMEKIGLITPTEVVAINDLNDKIGIENEDGKYAVGTLTGDYYLACANYEAYRNFMEHGAYTYAGGSKDPNNEADATGTADNKVEVPLDGSEEITYTNTYNPNTGSVIQFNGSSTYLSKVDLNTKFDSTTGEYSELTTQSGTLYDGENDNFNYTINNGSINYTYDSTSLLTALGKVQTDDIVDINGNACSWKGKVAYSQGNGTDKFNIKSDTTTWKQLIDENKMIQTFSEKNWVGGNPGEGTLKAIVYSLSSSVKNNGTIAVDEAAADKAAQSTIAFFCGKITNGGKIKSDWRRPAIEHDTIKEEVMDWSDDYNLNCGKRKGEWIWGPSQITFQAISARNLYNTYITFYNYYYNVPTANVIVNSTGLTEIPGESTEVNMYDPEKYVNETGTTFTSGGKTYIRLEAKEKDGGVTVYDYYEVGADGKATGQIIQTDSVGPAGQIQRIKYDYLNNEMTVRDIVGGGFLGDSIYNNSETNTIGFNGNWNNSKTYDGLNGAGVSSTKLTLSYTDQYGNLVEYVLGNKVSGSTYASNIAGGPVDHLAELKQVMDDAKTKLEEAVAERDKYFDSAENRMMDYFDAIFKMIAENGWVYDENINTSNKTASNNYLNAKLQNNMYFITEVDTLDGTDFNYSTKIATNVSKVFEIYDKDAQNTALSEYEAKKAEINTKDKEIDIRMNKLEAEQDAISTELESVKKIIEDNISTNFKIFT